MATNVGMIDRIIRIMLAIVLLYLGFGLYSGSALGIGFAVVGAIAALTGLVGFCGLYKLFGIDTHRAHPTL